MSVQLLLSEAPADLTTWFSQVASEPFAMLLDSASPNHPNSRYDLLVCRPLATLTAYGRACVTDAGGNTSAVEADPFELLATLQQRYLPALDANCTNLPFVGGVLGYFGYDLGRTIENLPEQACADIPLPDLAVGFYPQALVLDKASRQLWYVDSRGDAEKTVSAYLAIFQAADNAHAGPLEATEQQRTASSFHLTGQWQANLSQPEYLARFAKIQQYLQSGDCYQINLAQRFSAPFQGDPYQAYLQLRAANQAPFSAFIRLAQGAVLSISPERFLEVKARHIETKPIKGTRPRFAGPEADAQSAASLQQSPKDRAENVMIVDLLRNDLGKVAKAGTVRVPKLFAIESFPAVHHLVSTISAELAEPYQPLDALRAAFPGGSITGAPKVRAMQSIEELEPHRRSVYCGAIGYLSQHGHMDTNIAIRTLVAADNRIHCWAGGGIVADSVGTDEYQETYDKVARILPVLNPKLSSQASSSQTSASQSASDAH